MTLRCDAGENDAKLPEPNVALICFAIVPMNGASRSSCSLAHSCAARASRAGHRGVSSMNENSSGPAAWSRSSRSSRGSLPIHARDESSAAERVMNITYVCRSIAPFVQVAGSGRCCSTNHSRADCRSPCAAASSEERSQITGPIVQINIGSCNFSNLTEERSAHDLSATLDPKAPADFLPGQLTPEELRLWMADPPYSMAGLLDTRSVTDETVPKRASWASLPTSVVVAGQRVKLLMAVDSTRSKGQLRRNGTGTGCHCVTKWNAQNGVHVGYIARFPTMPNKFFSDFVYGK